MSFIERQDLQPSYVEALSLPELQLSTTCPKLSFEMSKWWEGLVCEPEEGSPAVPERTMLAAILERAIRDAISNEIPAPRRSTNKKVCPRKSAREWLYLDEEIPEEDLDYPTEFSFVHVCSELDMCPIVTRRWIMEAIPKFEEFRSKYALKRPNI